MSLIFVSQITKAFAHLLQTAFYLVFIFAIGTGVEIVEIAHEGPVEAAVGASALCQEHLANEGFSLDVRIGPCLHFALS